MKRFIKVLATVIFIAVILECFSAIVWFYNLDAPSLQHGKSKALPLLDAIQRYHEATGEFPASIQLLVPNYISAIPRPDWRHEYCYDLRDDKKSFTLAFVLRGEAIGDGWYVYSSSLDSWKRTDSDYWPPCTFFFDDRGP